MDETVWSDGKVLMGSLDPTDQSLTVPNLGGRPVAMSANQAAPPVLPLASF